MNDKAGLEIMETMELKQGREERKEVTCDQRRVIGVL
jgi:hypothetical protein